MKTISTKKIVEVTGLARKNVLERSRREGWAYIEKSGGFQFIEVRLPLDIRLALSVRDTPKPLQAQDAEASFAGNAYKKASDKARETATWRAALLAEYDRAKVNGVRIETFIASYNAQAVAPIIFEKLGNVSVPTLYRWLKARQESKGASGLVPAYGATRSGAGESLSEVEKAYLEYFWLTPAQHSAHYAWRMLKANIPDSACSYQTANRYLRSLPKPLIDFKRLGATRASNLHQPYIDQDIAKYPSMFRAVSDHHCLDMVVKYKGQLIRPWFTTFQDYRSGKILGWCPSVKPSSMSIIVAYYMMCIRHGIPWEGLFDNGQDYRSHVLNGSTEKIKVLTPEGLTEETEVYLDGVFSIIGTKIRFTNVYSGQSKGRQERFFRTFAEFFSKSSGSYVGSDTRSRSEEVQTYYRSINGVAKREEFPTWEWLLQSLGAMVEYMNNDVESDGKGMNGKTPNQVFQENLPEDVRMADKEILTLALTKGTVRRVRNNCVKVDGRLYFAQELFVYSGRDVIVRQRLNTDEEVLILDSSGATICTALADYTKEGEDLGETIARIKDAKNKNLLMLGMMGTGGVHVEPEFDSMIDVALKKYNNNTLLELDSQLEQGLTLPKAVGSDLHYEEPVSPKREKKSHLLNPFDATSSDYAAID